MTSPSETCKLNWLVLVLGICGLLSSATAQRTGNASCPVSFDYLSRFPSTLATCDRTDLRSNVTVCCSALLNSLGIALAENLKRTGDFEFRDNATATACLAGFQAGLNANGVKQDFLSTCFPYPYGDPSRFIRSKTLCAGIMTTDDWNQVVGRTDMDISCSGDLSRGADCQGCVADAEHVVTTLNERDPGRPECLYFTVLYGAGVINTLGPSEPSTLECLLGITSMDNESKSLDRAVVIALAVVVPATVLFVLVTGFLVWRLHVNRKAQAVLLSELGVYKPGSRVTPNRGLVVFKSSELKTATRNFSDVNLIGEGATARVYRGVLRSHGEVAIKVIKSNFVQELYEDDEQKFLEQMKLANSIKHRSLVQLRGCAVADKEGLLLQHRVMVVYDFMPNGNLENALFKNGLNRTLSWPERRKMAVDIATAINYLHNELHPAVIHRDIKPSNILLDANLNARLADFGLAKLDVPCESPHVPVAVGTPLFVAPEYALYGHLTTKSDVYSFGMVMLGLLSGQRPLFHHPDSNRQVHAAEWAWDLVKRNRSMDVYEGSIRGSGPESVMHRFVVVAVICAHPIVSVRPSISQVLAMLQGDLEVPESSHGLRPSFGLQVQEV